MKELISALRQYRHNYDVDGSQEFVIGYDKKETDRIVAKLLAVTRLPSTNSSDLQERLRKASNNPGCTHTNMHLFMDAANMIDWLINEIVQLKQEAAQKDAVDVVTSKFEGQ